MRVLILSLVAMLCSSCVAQEPYVVLAGERFKVELATTQQEQALGLMFRDSMRGFWMKNTRIPLDIFYFDEELRLVSVSENARPCRTQRCPNYPSAGPAKYVLELNGGKAAELGVQAGDVLELHID